MRIRLTRKKSNRKTEKQKSKNQNAQKYTQISNADWLRQLPSSFRLQGFVTMGPISPPTHQRTNEPLANQFKSKLAKGMQREKNDDGSEECFLFLFNSPVSVSDREKSARHFNDSCGHGVFKRPAKSRPPDGHSCFFLFGQHLPRPISDPNRYIYL